MAAFAVAPTVLSFLPPILSDSVLASVPSAVGWSPSLLGFAPGSLCGPFMWPESLAFPFP